MEKEVETKKVRTRKSRKDNKLYTNIIISRKINIPMLNIGGNLKDNMLKIIENQISGKCIMEGYIKSNSVNILSYSNGIQENETIKFQVVFECLVCNPSEGQFITCIAKNITKAGIRAEVEDDDNPLIIFVARDHNYLNKSFSNVKENQEIIVRVIGQRFELNDKNISVIADLVESKNKSKKLDIVDEASLDTGLEVNELSELSEEDN